MLIIFVDRKIDKKTNDLLRADWILSEPFHCDHKHQPYIAALSIYISPSAFVVFVCVCYAIIIRCNFRWPCWKHNTIINLSRATHGRSTFVQWLDMTRRMDFVVVRWCKVHLCILNNILRGRVYEESTERRRGWWWWWCGPYGILGFGDDLSIRFDAFAIL